MTNEERLEEIDELKRKIEKSKDVWEIHFLTTEFVKNTPHGSLNKLNECKIQKKLSCCGGN